MYALSYAYKNISDLLEAEIAKSGDEIVKVCLNGNTEAEFPLKITEFTIMGRVSKDTIAHYRNYQSGNTQKNVFTLCGDLQPILELLINHEDLLVSTVAVGRLYELKKDKNYTKNISKIQYAPIFRSLSETHPLLNSPNYTNFGNEVIENDISKSGENSVPLFDTVDDLLKVYDKNTISCIYKVYASGQLINMPTDYNVFKSFRILKQV